MRIRVWLATLLVVAALVACAGPVPTPTPTPRPTAPPAPTATPRPTATHTPVPTPTPIFQAILEGNADFVIAIPIGRTPLADAGAVAARLRQHYRETLLSLAERINLAVINGELPQLTQGSEVVFTFSDISAIGGAEVGAIVARDGRAWQVSPEGEIKLWVSEGVSLCADCSPFAEGGQRFIARQRAKYFQITGTDATGFVHKLVEVAPDGNPIEGGQEKASLLISALPNADAGKGILQIGGVAFLEKQAGMQLKFDGSFDPVAGLVEFKNPNGEVIASWDPLKGEWKTGGPNQVFAPEPTATPEVIQAPVVEGLRAVKEGENIVYYAESGNKYGMEKGALAGRAISLKIASGVIGAGEVKFENKTALVLHPQVIKKLHNDANTPEALAKGEWKVAIPFDPRGVSFEILERGDLFFIFKNELPTSFSVVSPYPEPTLAKSYESRSGGNKWADTIVLYPSLSAPEKDVNWGLVIMFKGKTSVTNEGVTVQLGEQVASDFSGEVSHPLFPDDTWIALTIGTLNGGRDFRLSNVLSVGEAPVFEMTTN